MQREVIKNVLALLIHPPQAVLNDHGDFIREGRIISQQIRNGAGEQQTVPVLVLQPFAVQGGAARRRAEQKALGLDVARQPHLVADALEAEHGIVNIERDHVNRVAGVGGAGGDERGHRTGLGYSFLQYLPVLGLFVIEQ